MARFLGLTGTPLATAISATCGLCFLCFGYAQGVMGGLLTVPKFLEAFPEVDLVNDSSFRNAWVTGLTVGTWNLGCIVSAVLTIFIGDVLGRRRTLILGLSLWIIGEIIQTSAHSFAQFIVGRAVAGFGNGFTTSTAPAYQAECVKSHRKGTILMISAGAFVSAGYALSYWFTFAFAYISTSSAAWRAPIALQILFALPAIAMLLVLPESPRWLILTGREQEALTVLAALNDGDPDDFETRDEFLQIKDAILIMAQGSTTSMFSNKERRSFHRVVLAYFVQIFQQGTGINLVLQYLSWIFLTRMNYSGWLSRLLASCSSTVYFLASFIVVVGIDRFWGRRSLMMFGAAGMSVCMVILTVLQYLWWEHDNNAARIAGTVFLFGFSVFFAIGWQGMAWLYQVEIVPLRIRGPANGLSTSANWLLNFVIVFITPIAFQRISYRTWIILAATNFAILPLVYFFYPETAFRSLEEVDVIFQLANDEPENPWFSVVRISKSEPLWFGKRGEKTEGFSYANTSWHQRLLNSSSGTSGTSGTSGSEDEKGIYGAITRYPEPGPGINPIPRGLGSSIDPQLRSSSSISPTTTCVTTIRSDNDRAPRGSRKSTQRSRERNVPSAEAVRTDRNHTYTRSASVASTASATPDQWSDRYGTSQRGSRAASAHKESHRSAHEKEQTRSAAVQGYHSRAVDHNDDSDSVISYPGRTGSERDSGFEHRGRRGYSQRGSVHEDGYGSASARESARGSARGSIQHNTVLTEGMRNSHLPDGVYEIRAGRVRSLSRESDGLWVARGAGRGA